MFGIIVVATIIDSKSTVKGLEGSSIFRERNSVPGTLYEKFGTRKGEAIRFSIAIAYLGFALYVSMSVFGYGITMVLIGLYSGFMLRQYIFVNQVVGNQENLIEHLKSDVKEKSTGEGGG